MIQPTLLSLSLLSVACADKDTWCLQNLNILTVGAKDGKGGFFPEGIAGRINTPEGFDALAEGIEDWEGKAEAIQVSCCCQNFAPQHMYYLAHGRTYPVQGRCKLPCTHLYLPAHHG